MVINNIFNLLTVELFMTSEQENLQKRALLLTIYLHSLNGKNKTSIQFPST